MSVWTPTVWHSFQKKVLFVEPWFVIMPWVLISSSGGMSRRKSLFKVIYQMAVDRMNCHNESDRWLRLNSPILPNYLNSFNFKVHFNLLPVRSKFLDFALDNESLCPFCNLNYETQFHIFGKCTKLNFVWDFLEEVLNIMNMKYPFFVMWSLRLCHYLHEYWWCLILFSWLS